MVRPFLILLLLLSLGIKAIILNPQSPGLWKRDLTKFFFAQEP